VTVDPAPVYCPPGYTLVRIGEATSERLCYIPAVLYVREVTYPKYVMVRISDAETKAADGAVASQTGEDDGCSGEDICGKDISGCAADVSDIPATMRNGDGGDGAPRRTVYRGEVEGHIVERGIPDESLLAQIAVSKYCDGIPLYRQVGIFARSEVDISRQTMANWMSRTAIALEPLAKRIMALIVSRDRIFADETHLPTLKPGNGKTAKGLSLGLRCGRNHAWRYVPSFGILYFRSQQGRGMPRAGAQILFGEIAG